MSSGRFGKALLPTGDTVLYTSPSTSVDALSVVNVNLVNVGSVSATIRLAIVTGSTPVDGDWIEFDTVIPIRSSFTRQTLTLSAGEKLIARSNVANTVVARAHGFQYPETSN